ncbi:MAG TPA: hypothetical protein VF360_01380 [Candidatus Methanoperedens sp.]
MNQRRIHGNRDVVHDLNFYGSYLPIVWNLGDDEYIKTVYAERRGRIIKFKHDDSEPFKIIEKGLENLESQSNGLLTP